jgi:hypothetical protein
MLERFPVGYRSCTKRGLIRMLFQPLKHVSPVGGTALRNGATSSRLVAEAAVFGRCDHDSAAAQEPAHNSAVLLLDPGLIVLAPWTGASEFDPMAEAILDEETRSQTHCRYHQAAARSSPRTCALAHVDVPQASRGGLSSSVSHYAALAAVDLWLKRS